MIHKILEITQVVMGSILLAIGGFLIIALLTGGAPIIPKVIGGPIVLLLIGVALLALRRKAT
jgi:hypothetical protein